MHLEPHRYREKETILFSVIKDGIFNKNEEGIPEVIGHETPFDTKPNQSELTYDATERTVELKTELASLLDGSSLKNPASVNAVVLWNCIAKHPTDLDIKKGERVRILYRNGELAFVENSQQKQGFVPLCYCSLYRRRSSSFSELFTETSRKISSVEEIAPSLNKGSNSQDQRDSGCKEMAGETVKRKRFGKMISKGTYDAKGAEYKSRKKSEKGILNSAAKKIMKAFTTSLPTRGRGKTYKGVPEKKPIPDWLRQLNFDYNNPDYSTSSDSSDEDDDSAYESFRPGSETRQSVMLYNGSENNTVDAQEHFQNRESIRGLNDTDRYSRDYSSQEFAIGYANVRKLRTSSKLDGNPVSRSRSFNLDSKTKTLHRVLQLKPKDLLDSSSSESEANDDSILANNFIKRAPSHGCIQYDNFVGPQSECLMEVLQDFITSDSKDLNVLKGEKVRVLNKNDDQWWLCETENGRGGFVPRKYLTLEHGTTWKNHGETDDDYLTKGRNDSQELLFRNKAASVKLARITPMAREPSLQQKCDAVSKKRDVNLTVWDRMESRSSGECTEDAIALKKGLYTGEYKANECYECMAACSTCHQNLIVGNSCNSFVTNCDIGWQSMALLNGSCRDIFDANESESKIFKAEEVDTCKKLGLEQDNSLLREKSIDSPSVDQSDSPKSYCSVLENSDHLTTVGVDDETEGKQKSSTEEGPTETGCQLPTYDEIMEQRNIHGLSEIKTRLSLQIEAIRKEVAQKASSNPGQVEKLLEEWRSQQKQSLGIIPSHERRVSSDSQSTISDSCDSAVPRVLRRRNSMGKRVRFHTPERLKTNDGISESEKGEVNSGIKKEHILATWM